MPDQLYTRPSPDEYFMGIAMSVRKRANCMGNRVGAVIVKDSRVLSTGYNGTPSGMPNCLDGGCHRCAHRDKYPSGTSYDLCICVHAEQNALLAAARFGIGIEGSTIYTTMSPCFGCAKELLQTKVIEVCYLHEWIYPNEEVQREYNHLIKHFAKGMRKLAMTDPDEQWAVSTKRRAKTLADDTGHGSV